MLQLKNHSLAVNYEWGSLKEAIVGISPRESIVIEKYYPGFSWANKILTDLSKKHSGKRLLDIDAQLAINIEKQVDLFAKFLEDAGIIIHRNNNLITPEEQTYLNPEAQGTLPYVRDPIIVINNTVIESSVKMIFRRRERYALRPLLQTMLPGYSCQWVAVPPAHPVMDEKDTQSLFLEGGDILLNGSEIYVGVSGQASNEKGAAWLQQFLGSHYHVHVIHLAKNFLHLDCAMSLIRPDLGLICRDAITGKLPESMNEFEFIEISTQEAENLAANICILDKNTVILDTHNIRIAKELRKRKLEVIPLPCDGPVVFGGGFRCLHHPLVRLD